MAAALAMPRTLSPLGWLRVSSRLLAMVLLLLVCIPLHFLFKLFTRHNLIPRFFLGAIAWIGLWIAVAGPALSAYQNLYQGVVVQGGRTRGVTESVVVGLAATAALLWAGVEWWDAAGLYAATAAIVGGNAAQVAWLRLRAGQTVRVAAARAPSSPPAASPSGAIIPR